MDTPKPFHFEPHDSDALASLPESRGIYLIVIPGSLPHLSWSIHLKRRLTRLLVPSYTQKGFGLGEYRQKVAYVECWPTGSRLESSLLLYTLTKKYFPQDYLKRLHLRMPWFVSLTTNEAFPRLDTVNRPMRRHGVTYGPFSGRDAAQRYEQEVLGLFQIRRCSDVWEPHPDHPGCIYGEMNQCMRPCQCAVTPEEYANELERVTQFLNSNGKSAAAALQTARERAANNLDFEQASQLHKRLERVTAAAACRDPIVESLDQFNGVALTKSSAALEFRMWLMLEGRWANPVTMRFEERQEGSAPLDRELRLLLQNALPAEPPAGNRVEHMALFSRWYYSSWRDGAWFPFRKIEELNYRRLVREISKLVREESRPAAK